VRLGGEVVDFIRLRLLDDANEIGRVGHVTEVENELRIFDVRIFIKVFDT
jgi:hypothetical protein